MNQKISYTSYRSTKKRLLKQLRPFSWRDFAHTITPIIAENRGIDYQDARFAKYLRSDEVLCFLEQIGEPKERFGRLVEFDTLRMSRYKLLSKIPFLSKNEFQQKIIAIVMHKRQLDFETARYTKILRRNEVLALLLEVGESVDF